MPLPTSVPETAESAYLRVVATASSVKSNLTGIANLLGPNPSGPVRMDNLIGLYQALKDSQAIGVSIQGVPGLPAYAQAALNDPSYDIVAAFGTSVVACKAVNDWLLANMPSDGNGGFVGWKLQTDGMIARLDVDPATLAPLAALIATALATFS